MRLQTIVLLVLNKTSLSSATSLSNALEQDSQVGALGLEYHKAKGAFGFAVDGSRVPSKLVTTAPVGQPWMRFFCYPESLQGSGVLECDVPPGIGRNIPVIVGWGNIWSTTDNLLVLSYAAARITFVSRVRFPVAGSVLLLRGSNLGSGPWMRHSRLILSPIEETAASSQHSCPRALPSSQLCIPFTASDILALQNNGSVHGAYGEVTLSNLSAEEKAFVHSWNSSVLFTWTDATIFCSVPPGVHEKVKLELVIEKGNEVITSLDQWEDTPFGYEQPMITNLSPTVHATHGFIHHADAGPSAYLRSDEQKQPSVLHINGLNFGFSGNVWLKGPTRKTLCPTLFWNDTTVICHVPPGQGWNISVVLSNCGQFAQCGGSPPTSTIIGAHHPFSALLSVSQWLPNNTVISDLLTDQFPMTVKPSLGRCQVGYFPPTILRVSPSIGPAAGGEPYTVHVEGLNFGLQPVALQRQRLSAGGVLSPAVALIEVPSPMMHDSLWRHSNTLVQVRPGVGRSDTITIVSEQQESLPTHIAYMPPLIEKIVPSLLVANAPFLRVAINGRNFGDARVTSYSLRFQEARCLNAYKTSGMEDIQIICEIDVASLPTQSLRVGKEAVKVEVAGQLSLPSPPLSVLCGEGFYGFEGSFCQPCPEGAFCPGGFFGPIALPGYWMHSDLTFQRCTPPSACRGGRNSSHQIVLIRRDGTDAESHLRLPAHVESMSTFWEPDAAGAEDENEEVWSDYQQGRQVDKVSRGARSIERYGPGCQRHYCTPCS